MLRPRASRTAASEAAVMPLPEGLSEMTFAGALNKRRFRYTYDAEGFCLSADADFVITGIVEPMENKPEGPFGDHLGYYSLQHPFPLLKVHRVYHRKNPIWSFTVVGRPPQEDSSFGELIHELTGAAIPKEIPGLHAVNAVDFAGVHPLLFALGSERYTPYLKERKPQEILTIANHILGKNQLSLAKYLFIAAKEDAPELDIHDLEAFLQHVLERIDLTRDIHFYTKTTIDTLDYSGSDLNAGSKVVFAVAGDKKRTLCTKLPANFSLPKGFEEGINYDMIGYYVPHTIYPNGYHCEPELPLPFMSIAVQKNHIALYHMGLYANVELLDWFVKSYNDLGGPSSFCLRPV